MKIEYGVTAVGLAWQFANVIGAVGIARSRRTLFNYALLTSQILYLANMIMLLVRSWQKFRNGKSNVVYYFEDSSGSGGDSDYQLFVNLSRVQLAVFYLSTLKPSLYDIHMDIDTLCVQERFKVIRSFMNYSKILEYILLGLSVALFLFCGVYWGMISDKVKTASLYAAIWVVFFLGIDNATGLVFLLKLYRRTSDLVKEHNTSADFYLSQARFVMRMIIGIVITSWTVLILFIVGVVVNDGKGNINLGLLIARSANSG
ncbi:hypothetical protein HDU76_001703 [Blyttiomyces sp. JEL0837]|nr:hypothetical protein HDU76_001703 [Blyttiomyces sp. JEL0837]